MNPSEIEEEEEAGHTIHHSMHLLWGYKTAFTSVFILTLILGAPLSINKWWHLRVSSNKSGRGVIKLMQVHYYMSLLSVPVILFDLAILLMPDQEIPKPTCILLKWSVSFLTMQRCHGDLSIAMGR